MGELIEKTTGYATYAGIQLDEEAGLGRARREVGVKVAGCAFSDVRVEDGEVFGLESNSSEAREGF